jgi:hypothetical protein
MIFLTGSGERFMRAVESGLDGGVMGDRVESELAKGPDAHPTHHGPTTP